MDQQRIKNKIHNQLTIGLHMILSIKNLSFISSGRGYFLSDKSDKNTSLGIIPKTLSSRFLILVLERLQALAFDKSRHYFL